MVDASALLAATEVVVIRGASYNPKHRRDNERLAVERDPLEVRTLVGLITDTIRDAESHAWMEWPAVSFVFIDRGKVLGELGLLSNAEWIREPESGDLPLAEPLRVVGWLRARGVELP